MNRFGPAPKKSLGQNFLRDANIARKIINALDLRESDWVLEIGPGHGALTRLIQPKVKRYIGVELDDHLAEQLRNEFNAKPNFELHHTDFLSIDFSRLLAPDFKTKIVGNIPYHLTSGVIFKVIEQRHFFENMTLMIQQEVAERVVAAPGSKLFGILSVLSQTFSLPTLLFTVSRHVFYPKPKVTSAVVQWQFENALYRLLDDEAGFMLMVKKLFQQRRKMLRTSLKYFYGNLPGLSGLPLDLSRRPEDLSIDEFLELWKVVSAVLTGR